MSTLSQETLIRKARELFEPSKVDIQRVPPWLRKRLIAALKAKSYTNVCATRHSGGLLESAANATDDSMWLDHWGVTTMSSVQYFVSEPYEYGFHLRAIQQFVDMLTLEYRVLANSWHFPGRTIRILFRPKNGA